MPLAIKDFLTLREAAQAIAAAQPHAIVDISNSNPANLTENNRHRRQTITLPQDHPPAARTRYWPATKSACTMALVPTSPSHHY
jgi:hypothetical protein